jgi:putative transposase
VGYAHRLSQNYAVRFATSDLEAFTMADYRRWHIAGGTFFFTVVTHSRVPLFANEIAREILGTKIRHCQQKWPFETNAIVLLPEHLHALWTLPAGDSHYPMRWAWIKKEFTKEWLAAGGIEQKVSYSRLRRGDHGVWQPRYWEHTIRDERDFDRHFDYLHYNPVKHGHVACPHEWPYSSFHRWMTAGVYEKEWGCTHRGMLTFDDLSQIGMEIDPRMPPGA